MSAAKDGVDGAACYVNLGTVHMSRIAAAIDVFGATVAFLDQYGGTAHHIGCIAAAIHVARDNSYRIDRIALRVVDGGQFADDDFRMRSDGSGSTLAAAKHATRDGRVS